MQYMSAMEPTASHHMDQIQTEPELNIHAAELRIRLALWLLDSKCALAN